MDRDDRPQNDGLFRSIAAHRRRVILNYLLNGTSGRASVGELVDHVFEEESHTSGPTREAIAITLYHVHLPKLADEGLVDVDLENCLVTTTDRTRQITFESLDESDGVQRTLSHRYSRAVCHYFRVNSTEVATLDGLVRFISDHDEQATDKKGIEIRLHHAILPKLAHAGFIEYDSRSQTVRYRAPKPVEDWLDHEVAKNAVPL